MPEALQKGSRPWTAQRILLALMRKHDYAQKIVLTEVYVDGGIADVVTITDAGYMREYEIKVTLADWKHDLGKDKFKWRKARVPERRCVTELYYVVPAWLAASPPPIVPEAGIIVVHDGGEGHNMQHDRLEVVRPATRIAARKVTLKEYAGYLKRFYYHHWAQRLRFLYGQHDEHFRKRDRAPGVIERRKPD